MQPNQKLQLGLLLVTWCVVSVQSLAGMASDRGPTMPEVRPTHPASPSPLAAPATTSPPSTSPTTTSPAASPATTRPSAGKLVDVETFRRLAAEHGDDAVLLDVRTPKEFAQGHIAGAINIDSSDPDFEQNLAALDRGKAYLVYCRTGRRSAQACVALDQLNFPGSLLYNLDGGIVAWEKAGQDVKK